MNTSNETELIRRAIKGDVSAFEELIIPYQKKVYNIALNFSKNHEDALELSQDALIKTFRSIAKFNGNSSFSTWIYRIATNTCIDRYRKTNNIKMIYIDEDVSYNEEKSYYLELKSSEPDPSQAYLQKELRTYLMDALNIIPVELKSVVVLRDIHGFNYEEISQILDLQLGTVKSRINRGRSRLREILLKNTELFDRKFV